MKLIGFFATLFSFQICIGQLPNMIPVDTSVYNYQSRLLTQFIDRFNNEDPLFQFNDPVENGINIAKKRNIVYLLNLQDTVLVNDTLTTIFVDQIAGENKNYRLSYFDSAWYAVAQCNILYKGKPGILSLTLKPGGNNKNGFKWFIVGINPFLVIEKLNQQELQNSLSPYSNEINFLDLYPFFNSNENQLPFIVDGFEIDYLSLLFYLINNNDIEFKGVRNIDYYFFQINDWYFKVSNFVRPTVASSGWLISGIYKADDSVKREFIQEKLFTRH